MSSTETVSTTPTIEATVHAGVPPLKNEADTSSEVGDTYEWWNISPLNSPLVHYHRSQGKHKRDRECIGNKILYFRRPLPHCYEIMLLRVPVTLFSLRSVEVLAVCGWVADIWLLVKTLFTVPAQVHSVFGFWPSLRVVPFSPIFGFGYYNNNRSNWISKTHSLVLLGIIAGLLTNRLLGIAYPRRWITVDEKY